MGEADGKKGANGAGPAQDLVPPARARLQPNKELGEKFAELIAKPDSHQLGVCGKLGINYRTHMRWLNADAEPGSDLAEYQIAVLTALDNERQLDLEGGRSQLDGCHPAKAGSYFNMFSLVHKSRFKRFYEDEDGQRHKVELTGADGGPLETSTAIRYVVTLPPEEPEE